MTIDLIFVYIFYGVKKVYYGVRRVGNEFRPKIPGLSNLGQFVRRNRRLANLQRVDVGGRFFPF